MPLPDTNHALVLNEEHCNRGPQVSAGPQTTRDEKLKARSEERYNQEMGKLYRQHVLKEQPVDLVQIGAAPKAAKKEEQEHELVGASGD